MLKFLMAVPLFLFPSVVEASGVVIREFVSRPVVETSTGTQHEEQHQQDEPERFRPRTDVLVDGVFHEPSMLAVYPVAGNVGRDLAIPFYVDVDPNGEGRDFECGRLTFNGHRGHDPYIRSFKEQEIGVPVFAARDGVVHDLRDGEPDQNTSDDPSLRSNYVFLRHGPNELTQYVHLKNGSITVEKGQFVTAGTQIGMVGSSGPSRAPHIHFEARVMNTAFEPMAGPCRPGRSYFVSQPDVGSGAILLGAAFSTQSFGNFRPAPHDDAPHTGTFVTGTQTIYFKVDMANVSARTNYRLMIQPPGSTPIVHASSGTLISYDAALAALWWGAELNLDRTGTWNMILEIDGSRTFVLPFTVVSSPGSVVNRAPNAISAEVGPVGLSAAQVPVCRVVSDLRPDPDYDVVRYRYRWTVDGAVAREVTSAAQSDALPRQFARARANISCSITPSDGQLEAQTATAHATVQETKRRSVGR